MAEQMPETENHMQASDYQKSQKAEASQGESGIHIDGSNTPNQGRELPGEGPYGAIVNAESRWKSATEAVSQGCSISPHLQPSPGFGITWDQAQKAVDDYNMIFTAHFPFIILDHDTTAAQLSVEKPLLFRTILMTAVDITSTQSLQIRESVDEWIGKHLLVMEGQSISTLQGLIVYITWATPCFYSDRRVTQLMYVALGLAHSLGITGHAIPGISRSKSDSEINEEYRAFLACYYILSFNSFQFGRSIPLSSSHVQFCVESLERLPEFRTDFLITKLVKYRQLIAKVPAIYEGLRENKWCPEALADASNQLDEKRNELDDIISNVALNHHKFLLLSMLYHCASMQLYIPMTHVIPNSEATALLQREYIQNCLQISQSFVSIIGSLSPDGVLYAPFTTITDIFSMFIAISRLLLVNIEGWDLKTARASVDLNAALDEFMAKIRAANQIRASRLATAATEPASVFFTVGTDDEKQHRIHMYAKLVESIKSWLDVQGVFRATNSEGPTSDAPWPSTGVHTSPQSPPWTYTYFFESLLRIDGQ